MGAEDRAGDHRVEGDWGGIQHKAGRFMVRETIFDFISLTYSPEHELQLFVGCWKLHIGDIADTHTDDFLLAVFNGGREAMFALGDMGSKNPHWL